MQETAKQSRNEEQVISFYHFTNCLTTHVKPSGDNKKAPRKSKYKTTKFFPFPKPTIPIANAINSKTIKNEEQSANIYHFSFALRHNSNSIPVDQQITIHKSPTLSSATNPHLGLAKQTNKQQIHKYIYSEREREREKEDYRNLVNESSSGGRVSLRLLGFKGPLLMIPNSKVLRNQAILSRVWINLHSDL